MSTYVLEEFTDGRARPFVISRSDGTSLFTLKPVDGRAASEILMKLNAATSLSPEDTDADLAVSA